MRLRTAVGDDVFGEGARRLWTDEGVETNALVCAGQATMLGAIFVEDDGDNRIVIAPGALSVFGPEHVDRSDVAGGDLLLVQLEIPVPTAAQALALAAAVGVLSVLDPAPAPADGSAAALLSAADLLTPDLGEAQALPGATGPLDPPGAARRLAEATGSAVVLTAGSHGAFVTTGGSVQHVPARPVEQVVDSTGAGDAFAGAGDAFAAGLAVALAEGADLVDAARFAAPAAAYCIRCPGVVPGLPRRADLEGGP